MRPKPILVTLAVLSALLAGCTPTEQPTHQAADVSTTTTAVTAEPTTEATPAAEATTPAPAKTTAKPKSKPTTSNPKPTTKKPSLKPTSKPPSGQQGVHPGAFCSPEGATGYTSKGTKMRCTRKAGEDRARWRAA